ncbi:DUF2842 domain-containing protein [Pseudoroseicyclus tamaricis]|uniref:DUF2842 domain-containing protein n=1 Tax=Pseudoroseicyclus tamaricis TaxID=2705421 RepID=A0A6B2JJ95_9RHOB|nr:DUF2842 domain-containing protein [Pseudoroseicyclus tamaricis]NDV01493.1 DUF2842 domain-containing protein [Pseudoroseicyclus tamaricis]
MALSYKARRRLSLLVLVIGLPGYIMVAVVIMSAIPRPPIWAELLIYIALGVVWALPLKAVFRGVGKEDPDAERRDS